MAFTTFIPSNSRRVIDAFHDYHWIGIDEGISEAIQGKPPKQSFREKVFGKKIDIRKLNKSLI